jgi:hypothetical protein
MRIRETGVVGRFVVAFLRDETGGGTMWALMLFVLVFGLGGLAVDGTNAFRIQASMQAAADAASHAAAIELAAQGESYDVDAVIDVALEYARKNLSEEDYGELLARDHVELGVFYPASHTFTAGIPETGLPNAVRVTLFASKNNNNPVPATMLRIAGINTWDVSVQSVSAAGGASDPCYTNGFLARGRVESGSQNTYVNDLCIHGDQGVKIGSTNVFGPGVDVTMPNLSDYDAGGDNRTTEGEAFSPTQGTMEIPLPDCVFTFIDGWANDGWDLTGGPGCESTAATPPGYTGVTEVHETLPADPDPGTLYIITGDKVSIGSYSELHDIAIVVTHPDGVIEFGSNVYVSNLLLAAKKEIKFGSNNVIGDPQYCDNGHDGNRRPR